MKKLICLLLAAAVFAACLCGCAASDKPAETAPAATPEALATPEPEAVKWTDDNLKESVYGFLGKDLSEDVYADELGCFTSVFILSDQVLFFNQPPFWDMMPDRPGVYTYGDCVYTETAAVNLDCLKYFPNLESLWVALCDVENTDFLAEMPRLKYLALCGCGIEDISVLADCDNLREITMHDNSISDLSPLADMELWDLFMSYNSISDISPLAEMEKLPEEIVLSYNSIGDISALAPNGRNDALAYLNLRNNNISDIAPLSGYTNITILSLTYNNISDVSPLKDMDKSMTIYLNGNPVQNLSELAGFERVYSDN